MAHLGFRRSRGLRGDIASVLNRLVGQGVIASYRTNFDAPEVQHGPHVTVTIADGRSPEDVRVLVISALMEVAIGIDLTVERA